VSDQQPSLVKALKATWRKPPQACQTHFLRDAAAPLIEQDRAQMVEIKAKICGIRAIEPQIEAAPPTDQSASIVGTYVLAGQRDRLVYLSESACQAIQLYLQDNQQQPNGFVWVRKNGRPISTTQLRRYVAQVGRAVGIEPLFPHRLRHTCATRLLNAGMHIVQIHLYLRYWRRQKMLGHADLNTIMIYALVRDAAVEADYRRFTSQIEHQCIPLSNTLIAADSWPTQVFKVQDTLDNSV